MGKRLNELTRAPVADDADWKGWAEEVSSGSDRSMAILAGANIEGDLVQLIFTELRIPEVRREELVSRDGPLSSFYAVICMAYAIDVIGEDDAKDLHVVRQIRNAFAHARKPIAFETPALAEEVDKLKDAATSGGYLGPDLSTRRGIFTAATGNLNFGIRQSAMAIERRRGR
jgi:hypothetical protein